MQSLLIVLAGQIIHRLAQTEAAPAAQHDERAEKELDVREDGEKVWCLLLSSASSFPRHPLPRAPQEHPVVGVSGALAVPFCEAGASRQLGHWLR